MYVLTCEVRSGRTQHQYGSSLQFQCHHNINRISGYLDCIVKEAIEIHLNKNHFNTDGSFMFSQAWSPLTNMLLNSKHDQAVQVFKTCSPTLLSRHQQQDKGLGRYIMIWTYFWDKFPNDKDRDCPQNVHLLTTQPPNVVASPRIFYCTCDYKLKICIT